MLRQGKHLFFGKVVLLLGILYPMKRYGLQQWRKSISNFYKKLYKQMIFNEIILIYMESLMELLIAGCLYLDAPSSNPSRTSVMSIITFYFMFIPIILIPALFFWMFTKSKKYVNSVAFRNKWGVLIQDITVHRET